MVDCGLALPCTQTVDIPLEPALSITNEGGGGAVQGTCTHGVGVTGLAAQPNGAAIGTGVQGTAQNGIGVLGTSVQSFGVIGAGGAGGVQGETQTGIAVQGQSQFGPAGVFEILQGGSSDPPNPNPAIVATTGARGNASAARFAIENPDNKGTALEVRTPGIGAAALFRNENTTNAAIVGVAVQTLSNKGEALLIDTQATGLFSIGNPAGTFSGDVDVFGTLAATSKSFVIDHPLDPANSYLVHASVESSEQANLYTGNAVLDDNGGAVVTLPNWVEALNEDFRYQLTCIGGAAPVYIAQEVSEGSFTIAGGSPGGKVSWQLVGVRKDPWARAHPLVVEEEKSPDDKGLYRHPELFGQSVDKRVARPSHPESLSPR